MTRHPPGQFYDLASGKECETAITGRFLSLIEARRNLETLLIILLVVFLLGGGGWGYRRWRS